MTSSESSPPPRPTDAQVAFADFLARRAAGEELDFDAWCAGRDESEKELRDLYADFRLEELAGGGLAPSATRTLDFLRRHRGGENPDPGISLSPEPAAESARASGDEPDSTSSSKLLEQLAGGEHRISRYKLKGEIDRGGMGAILRVWDDDLRRLIAMKVILGRESAKEAEHATSTGPRAEDVDSRTLARFLEEAQVTGQLDHPGVVPVHELGIDAEGRVYFTMRLVKGRELTEILKLVPKTPDAGAEDWTQARVLGVLLKVCEAVGYAHSKGVIHRDLKPANVMVGQFGEVYVMDWGVAKILGRDDGRDIRLQTRPEGSVSLVRSGRQDLADDPESPLMTMDGDVVGTPSYMPPEQARGQLELVDRRSDVYSLGAILYHLLTGQMPYVAPGERISPHTVLAMVCMGPPKPIAELAPSAPAELVAICDRAMEREREDRYSDVLELARDLRAFLEGRVVSAYEAGAVAELRKWVGRNRGLAAAIVVAVLLGFTALGGTAYVQREANKETKSLNDELTATYGTLGEIEKQKAGLDVELGDVRSQIQQLNVEREAFRADLVELQSQRRTLELQRDELAQLQSETELSVRWQSYVAGLRAAAMRIEVGDLADARELLDGCPEELRGWEWGHFRRSLDDSVLVLEGLGDEVTDVALRADGRVAAGYARDRELRVWRDGEVVLSERFSKPWFTDLEEALRVDRFAASGPGGVVRRFEPSTGTELEQLVLGDVGTTAVALLRDGEYLAVGTDEGEVLVVHWDDGAEVARIDAHPDFVTAVHSARGGEWVLSNGRENAVAVHSSLTGVEIARYTRGGRVMGLRGNAFTRPGTFGHSPDGERVLFLDGINTVLLWNTTDPDDPFAIDRVERSLRGFALDWPAERAAIATADATIRVIDLVGIDAESDREPKLILRGHDRFVSCVTFDRFGERIASGGGDGTVRIWNATTGEELESYLGHGEEVTALRFGAGGRRVVSGSDDGTIRVWYADPDSDPLAFRSDEYRERTFDRNQLLPGDSADLHGAALTPGGELLVTGSLDGTVRLWDARTGAELAVLAEHERGVTSVAISADGRYAVSGGKDDVVRVYDLETRTVLHELTGHTKDVADVGFSPDGSLVVSSSKDRTVRVHDFETGAERHALRALGGWMRAVEVDPSGRWVVASPGGASTILWDLETGERQERKLPGHGESVHDLLFVGRGLATAGADGLVRVVDFETGEELLELRGHEQAVTALALDDTGERIYTASADGTIRVWSAETGQELAQLGAHGTTPIQALAVTPAGDLVVSAGNRGLAYAWPRTRAQALHYVEQFELRRTAYRELEELLAELDFGAAVLERLDADETRPAVLVTEMRRQLALHPARADDSVYLGRLGRTRHAAERYEEALEHFRRADDLNRASAEPYNPLRDQIWIVICLAELGRVDEAEELYEGLGPELDATADMEVRLWQRIAEEALVVVDPPPSPLGDPEPGESEAAGAGGG